MTSEGSTTGLRFGRVATRMATLLSPLVIFLALPPFYNGIWVQVEGAMPWLHGLAAVGALGCGLMAWAGDPRALRALTYPLVVIPFALFVWGVVLLPATAIPALSLFGAPEHGFGALAYLDLAALTAAAFVTCAEVFWRRLTIAIVFAVIVGTFVLDALFRADHTWAPFFFGDYLAFYAAFAFAILGVQTRARPVFFTAAALLCLVLALLSSSKAAVLAIGAAVILLPVILRENSARTAIFLTIASPIVLSIAIVLVGSGWSEDYRDWLLRLTGIGPLPALLVDSWASMWSRAMLVVVGFQTLIDEPWRVLVGLGWGHYNEALLANLPIVEGRLHEYIGPSHVYWDAIRRVDFHSHNQYFEALLSGGLVAAVLVLAYGAAWVLSVPIQHRRLALFVAMLLVTLQTFWFQMPHTLPVMAIAAAILGGAEASEPRTMAPLRRLAPIGSFATVAVLLSAAFLSGVASTNARETLTQIDRIVARESGEPVASRFAAGLGEIYDAGLIQHAYARLTRAPEDPGPDILHAFLTRDLNARPPDSLKLSISVANILSGITFTVPDYVKRFGPIDVEYKDSMERVIRRAPRRSDILIPYFNYLLSGGRDAEALALANLILARHDNDAVGLWFSGVVMLGSPASSVAGMRNLRQSLASGIRNFMPIDETIVRRIEQ